MNNLLELNNILCFGIVEYEKGDDAQSIFKRADTALYRAKDTGRNKVIIG